MNVVLSTVKLKITLVCLDDIVVSCRTPEENTDNVRRIFTPLKEAGSHLSSGGASSLMKSSPTSGKSYFATAGNCITLDQSDTCIESTSLTLETQNVVRIVKPVFLCFVSSFAQVAAPQQKRLQEDQLVPSGSPNKEKLVTLDALIYDASHRQPLQ